MKVNKIIIGIIAAILIFCLGVAYQSHFGSDKENVNDSTKVSSSTEEDSVDIYSPGYQSNLRRMAREETEAMETEYVENHDFDKPILGLWEPYTGSKK